MNWRAIPALAVACDGCGEPILRTARSLDVTVTPCAGDDLDYTARSWSFVVHGWACAQLAMEGAKDRDGCPTTAPGRSA